MPLTSSLLRKNVVQRINGGIVNALVVDAHIHDGALDHAPSAAPAADVERVVAVARLRIAELVVVELVVVQIERIVAVVFGDDERVGAAVVQRQPHLFGADGEAAAVAHDVAFGILRAALQRGDFQLRFAGLHLAEHQRAPLRRICRGQPVGELDRNRPRRRALREGLEARIDSQTAADEVLGRFQLVRPFANLITVHHGRNRGVGGIRAAAARRLVQHARRDIFPDNLANRHVAIEAVMAAVAAV